MLNKIDVKALWKSGNICISVFIFLSAQRKDLRDPTGYLLKAEWQQCRAAELFDVLWLVDI